MATDIIPGVIFQDDDLIVIDKPAGITVNRSDTTIHETTVQDWIEKEFKISRHSGIPQSRGQNAEFKIEPGNDFYNRSGIVHRLDKETSGILLAAKNPNAFVHLQQQFKERTVKKTYLALAHGKIVPMSGEIRIPVGRLPWNRTQFGVVAGGREAITLYEVQQYYIMKSTNETVSLVKLEPLTGRTHQIRVHLKYLNNPIVSDFLYAGRKVSAADRTLLPRVFLHAAKISFQHPTTGERIVFESPLPGELQAFMEKNLILC